MSDEVVSVTLRCKECGKLYHLQTDDWSGLFCGNCESEEELVLLFLRRLPEQEQEHEQED